MAKVRIALARLPGGGGDVERRSPDEKVIDVLSQVCLCSPNLSPERERLGLYLLLGQK